ncbi:MAG: EFR1 family ferrodoxin [Candidatus Omnitrophica bacterium]|nr:EFR1 family ferrodoxin [Candidatus Omnitrophota bacterium]
MKTALFYFSGTGNSLVLARKLSAKLNGAEIISIAEAINKNIVVDVECVGIIFPVYMFGLPLIVLRFLKKLNPLKNKYIFAIADFGGAAGDPLGQMNQELKPLGLKLNAGFFVRMPDNYIPLFEAVKEDRQQKMFKKAEKRLEEIAPIILNRQEAKIEKTFFLLTAILSIIHKICSPQIPVMDKHFWVDEKCNGCELCQKVCPVFNIRIVDHKPVWLHHCEQCLACLHWCPTQAIQFFGKSTLKHKRYHHPETHITDFLSK